MKEIVIVWGERIRIDVIRESKSSYFATGDYKGRNYTVQKPTTGAAIKAWKDAAKNNGGEGGSSSKSKV